ncbi:hypothetical protein [Burkholderia gladioli]|uniref:hypothetical protein n=1 Tax=Burkholderia gladioli TaxID=28095 RepID=UPI001641701E|nr:hypothetical protein [Burkholderia gladioli]
MKAEHEVFDNTGECALCKEQKLLRKSHLMPKWAYKRLQTVHGSREDPIEVKNGLALYTSRQVTKYLLCGECEGFFGTREDYVAGLTRTDPDGLLEILTLVTRCEHPLTVVELNSKIDVDAIVYFAVSVIWRACVMTGECILGERHELAFRRYLLGEEQLQSEVSMNMVILEPSSLLAHPERYFTFPSSTKIPAAWLHGFTICGLMFRCFVGGGIDPKLKMVSLSRVGGGEVCLVE